MTEVPKGWIKTTFGALFEQRREYAIGDERLLSVTLGQGVIPQEFAGRRDISSQDKSLYRKVYPGDIVYNTMRMWQGVSGVSNLRGIVSPAYTVCLPRGGTDPKYISRMLKYPRYIKTFRSYSQGMVSDTWNLRFSSLADISVILPSALTEQRRIAEILDDLDEQIGATRRIVAKLRVAEGGLLHGLMRTIEDIATMGERGHWCRVGKAGSVTLGRQRSPLHDANSHRMPYLRVANVLDGHIDYSDVLSMSFSAAEFLVYELRPGDILLNEGQSIDLVGRCAIYDGPPGMCFQNTLVRFRSVDQVLPEYARLVFKHWLVAGAFAQVATRTTSIAHLGADRFAQMSFPLISRSEQVRLVSAVATFEDRLHAQLKAQDKLRMLKKGLMEDLLTGKVRVTRSGELTG